MKNKLLLVLFTGVILMGCGKSDAGNHITLAEPYKEYFKEAWEAGSKGEPPLMGCAQVVGTAAGMLMSNKDKNNEAKQAYEACYVDAFVNYAKAYFALEDNATIEGGHPKGCFKYRRALFMHKSSLDDYAERFNLDLDSLDARISEGAGKEASLCEGLPF